jgi:hypothetical protein
MLTSLLGGIGIGLLIMMGIIWVIGRKELPTESRLPKELVQFWEISIKQKETELIYLQKITAAIERYFL